MSILLSSLLCLLLFILGYVLGNIHIDHFRTPAFVLRDVKPLTPKHYKPKFKLASDRGVGQNASFFGARYQFPTQANTLRPTICIVSGGGTLSTSDFNAYCPLFTGTLSAFSNPYYNALDQALLDADYANATLENALDAQIIGKLCPYANIKLFIREDNDVFAAIVDAVTYLKTLSSSLSKIISCSWGLSEYFAGPEFVNYYSSYITSIVNPAGITLVCASGDNGSTDMAAYGMYDLCVDFPACLPFVISIGGTSISGSEYAWSYGGGGFSSYIPRPTYQSSVKTKFPSTLNGSALVQNRSLPDIAFNADPNQTPWLINVASYTSNSYMATALGRNTPIPTLISIGGTSCGAPAFAAFLGLCNNSSSRTRSNLTATKLYSAGSTCFNDITSGNNALIGDWSGSNLYVTTAGFDQCTGFGTIKGNVLKPKL